MGTGLTYPEECWRLAASQALTSGSVVSGVATIVRSAALTVDAAAPTGNYFLSLVDSASGVAPGGSITGQVWPQCVTHTSGSENVASFDFRELGARFPHGVTAVISTSQKTYAAAGAYMGFTVELG